MLDKISSKIKSWFSKSDEDLETHLPDNEKAVFSLVVDDIEIGILRSDEGFWEFRYSEGFKQKVNEYNLITGFPEVDKIYRSKILWPFFLVRIPGLKQPYIQKTIQEEKIDQTNEVSLLKRFGRKTISNPYELIPR